MIETAVYIALLGILIGGFIQVGFHIIEGSERMNEKVIVLEEKNFVLKKLQYYLNTIEEITLPHKGEEGEMLRARTYEGDLTLSLNEEEKSVWIEKESVAMSLNTDSIVIGELSFHYFSKNGEDWITALVEINGEEFSFISMVPKD